MNIVAEQYWKLRAEEGDRQRAQAQAEFVLQQVVEARKAAFAALGLSSDKKYRMDDTSCTIEEVTE
jgi:hypothetical protein